jgi:hypothetical protein
MQKVVGSSPIIRLQKPPETGAFLCGTDGAIAPRTAAWHVCGKQRVGDAVFGRAAAQPSVVDDVGEYLTDRGGRKLDDVDGLPDGEALRRVSVPRASCAGSARATPEDLKAF